MEELVGAYIIDGYGNKVPDLSDEAMAARHAMKKQKETEEQEEIKEVENYAVGE